MSYMNTMEKTSDESVRRDGYENNLVSHQREEKPKMPTSFLAFFLHLQLN